MSQLLKLFDEIFSPRQFFTNGEQGIWLDPSDFSTLFQDAAGTTPVTALGQPVGKILDKSGRGNHASQTTAASRPTVEARVNLIIASSENIGGAGWGGVTGNTYTHNSVIVDGIGLTLVVPTVTSNAKSPYTSCAASTGIPNRVISAYCKPAGYRYIHIADTYSGSFGLLVFDSQTGTFTQNSLGLTVSAVSIGSGVYKFSFVAPSAVNIAPAFSASPTSTAASVYNSTFAGDGVSGVYIGGIEIRNPADSAYPYQRVNTATDYVDVGAPRYNALDKTDDHLLVAAGGAGTTGFLLVAGIMVPAAGTARTLWSDRGTNTGYKVGIDASNQIVFSAGNGAAFTTVTGPALVAGTKYVITAWHDGANLNISVNNGAPTQAAFVTATAGTATFTIGKSNGAATEYWGDRIYGMVYRKNDTSAPSQRSSLYSYMVGKMGGL